jgi:branched-chain amino acid transport system permease protein
LIPEYLISALVYGCLFSMMSMGLTLTYMTTKVPNFAYGSFVTLGIYSSYTMVKVFGSNPYVGSVLGFVVGALVSAVMYLGILRPLARRGSSLVSLMIATFGVDIGFIGVFGIYTDYLQQVKQLIDAPQFYQLGPDFSLGGVAGVTFVAPLSVIGIVLAIYLLFTRTKFGVAMRAAVENPPLARTLGINVDRVTTVSWMLAGGFAGYAGALLTLQLPAGTATGSNLIVEIFSSSVLGGLTTIFGAAVGGLIIGWSEILVTLDLGLGFGYALTGIIAAVLIVLGFIVVTGKAKLPVTKVREVFTGGARNKGVWLSGQGVLAIILLALGVYTFVEMATGFTADLFVGGLVNGFGPDVTPFQQAIPLLIMVVTLMVIPQGLFSLNVRKILGREKK